MNKAIILFFLSTFLAAQNTTVEFVETRYIEALNEKITKKGEAEFGANHTSIRYLPPNTREITLENNTITIQTKDSTMQKSIQEERELGLMLTLLEAIFKKDEAKIKSFFTVTNNTSEIVLTPIATSAHIFKIIYTSDEDKIKQIEFFFWDNSRITIDVVKKR
ncbi:MAG: hypothetical protein LBF13_00125 [Campylobacteraceae bacterium]|jgi:hypothetical protein|nr:hypothetical protein [Campylobacteraceae bacterium]